MKIKRILILLPLLLTACFTITDPPKTVSHVDLKDYMGTWYEIAAFPNSFQSGCQCTSADYELVGSKVRVLNKCYKGKDHTLSEAKGTAWALPKSGNSKLKVQFFWPFTGDYWILYLSPQYKEVIVGSPDRKYLWLLSRRKYIEKTLYNHLRQIAESKGYDTRKLVKTQQTCKIPQ